MPVRIRPFIKWAGGKAIFISEISKYVPIFTNGCTYYDPFLGAASLFLSIQPQKAKLSDLNPQLIATYQYIKDSPRAVYGYLKEFDREHSEATYYEVRDDYNKQRESARQAARFIYLNKAGFNGVFRVNEAGQFNVPSGKREYLVLPSLTELLAISNSLKTVKLDTCDYTKALAKVKKGDFVYLDPPYPALNGSSFFTHYTKERFSNEDQERVADVAKSLKALGANILVSNADTPTIRKLYANWKFEKVSRPRYVRVGNVKHQVSELIIRSFA